MAAQNLLQPVLISVFAVLFGDYFVALFPALEGYKTLISIVILLIYTGIAWQGNHTFAFVNNIMVVVLMVAMGCYIFVGMPSIDTSRLTLGEIFNPGVKLTSFAAAVGVLASSLSGGSAVSQIADDVKNPNRNIPLALLLSPTIVAFIYIGMGIVTIGCMPAGELTTLSEVGKIFLPSGLLTFFIVGGPLFGVLTSMVPVIMLTCAQIQAAADNDLFPAFVGKKNKNGVSPVILCFVMLFSICCVATGSSFGVLMTVFSFVNALSDIALCLVPFFLKKKYPHACNHSTFKMAIGLVYALSAFAFVVAAYLAYAMISTLGMTVWLMILGAIVLFVIYILIRISYLKKHGRDLIAELKQPYEPWEARERECKAMDEGK
ncbi:putative uncharacterized protein [Blautia sp. CAG:52]|nr:putative uncharacterized protein [Blautia sp. CAG:52]